MAATTDQLHTDAVTAEKALEDLATGIAGLGADDNTVKGVKQMADSCRQIALHLAQGGNAQPAEEQAAGPQPPASTHEAIANHMAQRRAAAQQPPA